MLQFECESVVPYSLMHCPRFRSGALLFYLRSMKWLLFGFTLCGFLLLFTIFLGIFLMFGN